MTDAFIGQIMCFAGGRPIAGSWLPCDGATLKISEYQALYAVIGATYGGGRTTFKVPDLRGAFPVGCADGLVALGQTGGAVSTVLQAQHLPPHSHDLRAAGPGTGTTEAIQSTKAASQTALTPTPIAAAGGSAPVPTMPPYVAVSYYIAVSGIFPESGP